MMVQEEIIKAEQANEEQILLLKYFKGNDMYYCTSPLPQEERMALAEFINKSSRVARHYAYTPVQNS